MTSWQGLPTEERFWLHVTKGEPDECWPYAGGMHRFGYGEFSTYANGKQKKSYAHRYSLSLVEELDPAKVVLHLCDNPPCVNPAHLKQGTQAENIHDAHAKGRLNLSGLEIGQKMTSRTRINTRCLRDHDMTDPENVYISPKRGSRICRACTKFRRERDKQRKRRRGAAKRAAA